MIYTIKSKNIHKIASDINKRLRIYLEYDNMTSLFDEKATWDFSSLDQEDLENASRIFIQSGYNYSIIK
jgi:hypothetical protein